MRAKRAHIKQYILHKGRYIMKQFDELSLLEIVDEVKDGDLIGIPADYSGVPMTFTKELIKKGVNNIPDQWDLENMEWKIQNRVKG